MFNDQDIEFIIYIMVRRILHNFSLIHLKNKFIAIRLLDKKKKKNLRLYILPYKEVLHSLDTNKIMFIYL